MEEDEEKMQKRMESSCSSSTSAMTGEMEYGSASGLFLVFSFFFFLQNSVKNLLMASFCVLVFAAISYNDPMEEPETASVARQGSLPRGNRSVSQTSSFCLTLAKCSQNLYENSSGMMRLKLTLKS